MDSGWGPHPISTGDFRLVLSGESLVVDIDDPENPGESDVRDFASYAYRGSPAGIFTVVDGSTIGETIAEVGGFRPDVGLNRYRWLQSDLSGVWVLEAGNARLVFLCFDTELASRYQPRIAN